jgi:serine protease Do
VNEESPAEAAGITAGDIILKVNGEAVESLEKFYGKLWTPGAQAGAEVHLTVLHGVSLREVIVRSIERDSYMRRKPSV